MAEASTGTSEANDPLKELVSAAAGVVAGSKNRMGPRKAMEYVGFSVDQCKNMTLYQKVRRLSKKLAVVEKGKAKDLPPPPPPAAAAAVNTPPAEEVPTNPHSSASSLTLDARLADIADDESSDIESVRRRLTEDNSNSVSSTEKTKVSRRTSKEVHRHNANLAAAKARNSKAMKAATTLIKRSQELPSDHPEKRSISQIVESVNKRYKASINEKTASRYVRQGMIGISPLKKGPIGDFSKPMYKALMGAYSTYLKLEQAGSKKQSGLIQMAKLVNSTVNYGGFHKTRTDLTRKLQRDTADHFSVGKANVTEYRRVQWTTAYSLEVWFNTWKDLLIELGFAREKTPEDLVEGELVFYVGQLERILNIDETDGSIDDTTGQRGGRPPMTFMAPDVAGGATAVNKSGYSATIICGSNAKGEPVPPHFQLKTMAKLTENQKMSVEWFGGCKDTIAKFGHSHRRSLPCAFGMNEKAGMNAVELDKYISNSLVPLYPDIADVKGKRVLLKADSGPGRMNEEMLAHLRLKGFYIVPGVPNTTGKTQETDQNYGPFKGGFRSNIRLLSQARFELGMNLQVSDLPLLVFGGDCRKTGVELQDTFSGSFSIASNLSCWRKCGAVPLTRLPLQSKGVRREVAVGDAARLVEGEAVDPEVQRIEGLDALNQFYCEYLTNQGFAGVHMRKEAPKRVTHVAVTKPQSLERVKAIKEAKSAGQLFFATGGRHINSDEFFKAREMKRRQEEVTKMEEAKKQRGLYCKEQKGAVLLLRGKGELTAETEKGFTLPEIKTLLKWKKVKPTSNRKRDMVDAHVAAPKPKTQKVWCRSEEEALQAMKKEEIEIKDTTLGVAASQMARALANNLDQLDDVSKEALRKAFDKKEEET